MLTRAANEDGGRIKMTDLCFLNHEEYEAAVSKD